MTPLEAAKALINHGPFDTGNDGEYYRRCIFCGIEPDSLPPTEYGYRGHRGEAHEQGCPWPGMIPIVAALERCTCQASDQE